MATRARRVDRNQRTIVQALERVGCVVIDLHEVGYGCPDLLAARGEGLYLLEVKNLEGRGRRYTPQQRDLIAEIIAVGGTVHEVTSIEEALRAVGLKEV